MSDSHDDVQGTTQEEMRRRLCREIEQRNVLLAVIKMMNSERNLRRLLKMIATEAAKIVNADRSAIFLYNPATRDLFSAPALGEAEEIRFPAGEGIAGEVLRTGKIINAPVARDYPAFTGHVDKVTGYHTESLLAVPMHNNSGDMIGVFEAVNSRNKRFSEEDVELLTAFASHATIAIENARDYEDLLNGRDAALEALRTQHDIAGDSKAIRELLSQISRIAGSDATVLLRGESGTGKELAARAIHYESPRRAKPLICLNCAAVPETLLESELFGHEKGAFTGAIATKKGKFELAHEGTIFLDEVGELSPGGQTRFLRVLEDGCLEHVGGTKTIRVDIRVVAATNRDLEKAVADKQFREDLYYRLRVIEIVLPPLREREGDIPALAKYFLEKLREQTGHRIQGFTEAAVATIEDYSWPGNVRELKNAIERAVVLCRGVRIDADDLGLPTESEEEEGVGAIPPVGARSLQESEKDHIIRVLKETGGRKARTARILGIDRTTLYRKMKRYGLQ